MSRAPSTAAPAANAANAADAIAGADRLWPRRLLQPILPNPQHPLASPKRGIAKIFAFLTENFLRQVKSKSKQIFLGQFMKSVNFLKRFLRKF